MSRRNSSIITVLSLLLFSLIAITSCEKDDDLYTIENTTITQKMTGSRLSLSQIKREDHDLFHFISERALSIAKSGNSSNGTILDTTHIQVLEGVDFKNYIFKVVQDSTHTPDVLKNYMLVILKDSIQHQYMVTYPYVNQVIDTTNVVIEPVFGTDILNQVTLKCGGGSFQSVWVPGGYVDIRCQSGQHTADAGPGTGGADGCQYYGIKGSASRLYYEGYFTTQYVEQQPCYTFDPGNPGNGGGGTPGDVPPPPDDNSDDDNEDQVNISVGVTPNDGLEPVLIDPECKKLKNILKEQDTTKNEFKFTKRLMEMRHDSVLNLVNQEVSVGMSSWSSENLVHHRGNPNTLMPSMTGRIKAFAHSHDNRSTGTYSVFSFADLQSFADQSYQNKLDAGFTAFLVTNDGTEFALTINDTQKLQEFFSPVIKPAPSTSDIIAYQKHFNATIKWTDLYRKYFNPRNGTPPINESNSTQSQLNAELKAFLEFIKEANLGVDILRPDPNNPDNYEKLELDNNNNIKSTPC